MKWFLGVRDPEKLKKRYRELSRKYHPDVGGSEEIMKEINAEYDMLTSVKYENDHAVDTNASTTRIDDAIGILFINGVEKYFFHKAINSNYMMHISANARSLHGFYIAKGTIVGSRVANLTVLATNSGTSDMMMTYIRNMQPTRLLESASIIIFNPNDNDARFKAYIVDSNIYINSNDFNYAYTSKFNIGDFNRREFAAGSYKIDLSDKRYIDLIFSHYDIEKVQEYPTMYKNLKFNLPIEPSRILSSKEWSSRICHGMNNKKEKGFVSACKDDTNTIFIYYNTVNIINDMDRFRIHVGYDYGIENFGFFINLFNKRAMKKRKIKLWIRKFFKGAFKTK